jgi:hypothetical protein
MGRRRGRPGLLGTMTRTAVVAGTATATAGAVHGHQAKKQAQQQAATAPPAESSAAAQAPAQTQATPPATGGGGLTEETMAKLTQLSEMHASGVLTDDEFTAAKARLLGL